MRKLIVTGIALDTSQAQMSAAAQIENTSVDTKVLAARKDTGADNATLAGFASKKE